MSQSLVKALSLLSFLVVVVYSYLHFQNKLEHSAESTPRASPDSSSPSIDWNPTTFKEEFQQAHWTHQLELKGIFPQETPAIMTPALGTFPALYSPRVFRGVLQEGGIRLRWRPHPKNPVEGIRYQIERWRGNQESMQVLTTTEGLEFMDSVDCEGMEYSYRVSSVLQREIQTTGNRTRTVHRASPAITLRMEVPRQSGWKAVLGPERSLKLSFQRPGLPVVGPYATQEGQEIADTQWVLESFKKEETTQVVVTSIPRFDGLGRRVIIGDEPAFRRRRENQPKSFLTVHLIDPCGQPWTTQIPLPGEPPLPQ